MKPGPNAPALQTLVGGLLGTTDGTTYVYERTSGTSTRYDLGSDRPLIGRNAPEFRLQDGIRLGDLLPDGRGVLLDFSTDQHLRDAAKGWADRVRYAAGPARDDLGVRAVLVRPDGIVARAGDANREAFERSLSRGRGFMVARTAAM
jgi:hypothetical protein